MAPAVSVPEKTLEHWCSQYVTYRYRAQAGLWWPSSGADIDVRFLPRVPGKAFQLELKTTYFGRGYHDVWVDLGQLMRYWNRRRASQPFYAFPWPDWYGELEPVAVHHGVEPTSMGFSRSGTGWWFAEWMVVLTIDDVMNTLLSEVRAHRAAHAAAGTSEETRGMSARLARFRPTGGVGNWVPEWGDGSGPSPSVMGWRELWDRLQSCGKPDWPQLVQLPESYLDDHSGPLSHADVRAMLLRSGDAANRDYGPLAWLETTDGGAFEVFEPGETRPQLGQRDLPAERQTSHESADLPSDAVSGADSMDPDAQMADRELSLRRPDTDEVVGDGIARDTRQLTFLGASLIV